MAIDTLGANALASDSVTTAKIVNDAVTAAKIPAGAVVADIADGGITTAKLADDAITGAKLANDIAISTTGNIATTGSGTITSAGLITASGNVAIGGTGSANTLDDYETGFFTPTLTPGSGSIGLSHANGLYNKVGDTVHVQINMFTTSASGLGGSLTVGGLPFTSAANNAYGSSTAYNGRVAGALYVDLQASGASGEFMFLLFANGTTGGIYLGEDTSNQNLATYFDASSYIVLGLTYIAQ